MKKIGITAAALIGLTLAQNVPAADAFNAEATIRNYVLPADNGYYLLCDGHLYFWGGDVTKMAVPLCSRPNCDHKSEEYCAAYVCFAAEKMFYVDGGLYFLSSMPRSDQQTGEKVLPVWRVEEDGTGKEIVCGIPESPLSQYTIYQDMLYYPVTEETDGSYQLSVWQMTLDGKDKKQIWKSELYDGGITTLQGIGDWLYIWESGYEEVIDWTDEELDIDSLHTQVNLNLYQPQTGELQEKLYYHEKEDMAPAIRSVFQDEIYMTYFDSEEMVQNVWKKSADDLEEPQFLGTFPKETYTWDDLYGYTWAIRDRENNEAWFEIYDYAAAAGAVWMEQPKAGGADAGGRLFAEDE